jgi:GNAT superfamily N-acetyltransferase
MNGPVHIVVKKPSDCSEAELDDFVALVLAGGEVTSSGLKALVKAATFLLFLVPNQCLCGIAAVKRPRLSYRKSVTQKAALSLDEPEFPYELGWVFVMPSARGNGYSRELVERALTAVGDAGVFATSRSDNSFMHQSLEGAGFVRDGRLYASTRGKYRLQVFTRKLIKPEQTVTAVNEEEVPFAGG